MERVIVVATDEDENLFIKTFNYIDDNQLQEEVQGYIGECTFYVIYDEDLDQLEEAIEDMETPPRHSSKLTNDDVKTIKLMVESGDYKKKEIAKHFGVSRQTIWKVCQGI